MGKSFLENLIEEVLNRIKDVSLAQKQEIVGFKDKSVDGLSDYLVGKKLLDEEQLTEIKASAWNLPYKNLFAIKIGQCRKSSLYRPYFCSKIMPSSSPNAKRT